MNEHKTTQQSALKLVSGLGSGKCGTREWWHQRITSVAMVFLGLWVVYAFTCQVPGDYDGTIIWVKRPLHAILLTLTILVGLYHGALGLQVVIEDYIHTPWLKLAALYTIKFLAVFLAIGSLMAVIKIIYIPY